jgi:hypothetical protein
VSTAKVPRCHRDGPAPTLLPPGCRNAPLYGDVAAWAPVVQYDLCTDQMPPLDGGIAIAPADRLAILDWIQCGDVE